MPRWDHTLKLKDIFHNDELPFEKKRDEIVRRIKSSKFYDKDNYDLWNVVDDLSRAKNVAEFDQDWDAFYDYADSARIWVETF